ncbi:hypothetical protein JB92DRAFT_1542222 [Gautieria morchelliformis]|nr:hypothetical protein JB92DRAFT_1542222 [Gautieria morchelliformis]
MQPSELEIRREVEALKDIRRRSSAQGGPGAIPLDPDLPELPPSPSSPHATPTWPDEQEPDVTEDPSHLFWVPARLHPELAPGEFRAFLKEHARDGGVALQRANSASSSSSTSPIGRKKSMLSRQYRPSESDGVEEEEAVPIRRTKSSLHSNPAPQLTISDLQKLEALAEEASVSDDPSKLRSMLRRSLSLNVSPSLMDQMDDVPDLDEADSPIIVPRPNQILRRAARTKIRKPNLQGDGGGHRFPSTRRGAQRAQTIATSDGSEHDHEEPPMPKQAQLAEPHEERPISYTDEVFIFDAYADRRGSLTSSESHDRSDEDVRETTFSPSPPPNLPLLRRSTSPPQEPPQSSPSPPPALYQPTPQQLNLVPVSSGIVPPSRTPSPSFSDAGSTEVGSPAVSIAYASSSEAPAPMRREEPPPVRTRPPPSPISPSRKEKEKKGGLFGKWGSKEDKKKATKGETVREKELREREREKEKESGFFGSLFGGKKKQEDSASPPGLLHGSSGPATAAALLGASKSSKSYIALPSPQLAGVYARYPIHVERAVYRLSHIKLANPRRPLYEQVLISNLMFWYLGVINKAQQGGAAVGAGAAAGSQAPGQGHNQSHGAAQPDMESQEREQMERAEKERPERERERAEQGRRERKSSLTKAPKPGGESGGSRRAEIPVRGPQYESQHRAMEQEYSYGGTSNQGPSTSPPIRAGSAPPSSQAGSSGYQYSDHRMSQPMMQGGSSSPPGHAAMQQGGSGSPPGHHVIQQGMQAGQYYYNPGIEGQGHNQIPQSTMSYSLPPGAMMPLEQSWFSTSSGQTVSSLSSPLDKHNSYSHTPHATPSGQQQPQAAPRRQRSPSPKNLGHGKHPTVTPPGARLQGRSLSAAAVPAPHVLQNGKLRKKHTSAMAAPVRRRSSDGGGAYGDEDLPLAVWQQQQRASGRR